MLKAYKISYWPKPHTLRVKYVVCSSKEDVIEKLMAKDVQYSKVFDTNIEEISLDLVSAGDLSVAELMRVFAHSGYQNV